jgi:uncharacterized protein (DUF1330 family)
MPKGYIIGQITVTDPEGYPEYVRRDTPILESHGAKFVDPRRSVRGQGRARLATAMW